MNYITASQAAARWGVSEGIVRRYCRDERIPGAYQEFETWYIPENAAKPTRKKKEASQLPKLLKTLIKQRDGRMYRGLYVYLQINMVYSNGRMASNRLSRDQIEVLYKTDRIFTNREPVKVNDIIEARNHFLCVDMILSNAMKPLTQTFIQQLQSTLLSESCRHKRHTPIASGYRKTATTPKFGKTTPPAEISAAINQLSKEYEAQKDIGFHEILDLHVQFERIRPFEDCKRTFECKELCDRENVSFDDGQTMLWGCRYVHSMINPNTGLPTHLDGATLFLLCFYIPITNQNSIFPTIRKSSENVIKVVLL